MGRESVAQVTAHRIATAVSDHRDVWVVLAAIIIYYALIGMAR